MDTLNENLGDNQIIYQQYFNDNLLVNEKKKRTIIKILLICGIILVAIEIILHILLIFGMCLGFINAGDCTDYEGERREECEEEFRNDEKNFDTALRFIMPCLILSCIIVCLILGNNKKISIINCILITLKFFLYICFLVNVSKLWTKDKYIPILICISLEIAPDLCLIIREILKIDLK